jgi:multicomponent Na+:H+ antiporter subunit D
MVTQAAVDGHLQVVWLLLTAASAGVFLHAGIKFPWFVFFQKDSGLRPAEPPAPMRWAMVCFALLCVALGVWPEPLYALLPYPVQYVPYTAAHVLTQLQLLLFSGLAFFVMLPWLKRTPTITLDSDWLWRRAGPAVVAPLAAALGAADRALRRGLLAGLRRVVDQVMRRHGPGGVFARTWPVSTMAVAVMALMLVYLLLYYF